MGRWLSQGSACLLYKTRPRAAGLEGVFLPSSLDFRVIKTRRLNVVFLMIHLSLLFRKSLELTASSSMKESQTQCELSSGASRMMA